MQRMIHTGSGDCRWLVASSLFTLAVCAVAFAEGGPAGTIGWNYARDNCSKVAGKCQTQECCEQCCTNKFRDDTIELTNCKAYCAAFPW